ncbi:MAG: magnesium transporter [Lentisphaeria bacterium]|nr:magnesium transporter [Lentisphaeria bacterium]MDY0175602.1 magnesium transporter [Lentisphaeria bacterium]NLZ61009.1 magnesium transporter [Lentisphaerota bacterium]
MPKLHDFLHKGSFSSLQASLLEMNPVDLAQELEQMDRGEMMMVFRLMPKDLAAAVFTYLDSSLHQHIVESITAHEIRELIDEMFIDDAVDLLEELPSNMVRAIINNTSSGTRSLINTFLKYPENSAGSLMTVEFVGLFEDMSCKEALDLIRHSGVDKETIYTCYVTDKSRHLTGAVSLRRILLSDNDCLISEIMHSSVISVHTSDDQEEVAQKFQLYDLLAMPVVDREGRIVGIITIDDIVDVIEAENTEDMELMAALHPSETEYMKTGVWELSRNRIVWLTILMISATFTSMIIGRYEDMLQKAVLLAAFIPMLMDTGGNCGSQAATLIIRGMAVGEIHLQDWWKIVWKELRVGCLVGLMLGALNFARVSIFANNGFMVDLCVTITLFLTVVLAKTMGCILPLFAKFCKWDPALMASPLITTIVDTFSLLIYFAVAQMLL